MPLEIQTGSTGLPTIKEEQIWKRDARPLGELKRLIVR
jgi:hypothetical protein